jgi:hypothetical protein
MRTYYDEDRWLGQPHYPILVVENDTMEPRTSQRKPTTRDAEDARQVAPGPLSAGLRSPPMRGIAGDGNTRGIHGFSMGAGCIGRSEIGTVGARPGRPLMAATVPSRVPSGGPIRKRCGGIDRHAGPKQI